MPPLLADFIHTRGCKPICAKLLTLPVIRSDNALIYKKLLEGRTKATNRKSWSPLFYIFPDDSS